MVPQTAMIIAFEMMTNDHGAFVRDAHNMRW